MKNKPKILGICNAYIPENIEQNLDYAIFSLYTEGKKEYDDVILFDPKQIYYKFERGNEQPKIYFNDRDISNMSSLIIRRTEGVKRAVVLLVRAMKLCGCDVMDPIARFTGDSPSNLMTTFKTFKEGIGINSYIVFSRENGIRLIKQFVDKQKFPLLAKSFFASHCKEVVTLNNSIELKEFLETYFRGESFSNFPLLFQQLIEIIEEYYLYLVDGECVAMIQKTPEKSTNELTAVRN